MKPAGFMAEAIVTAARAEGKAKAWLLDQRGTVEELMAASTRLAQVGTTLNHVARALDRGGQAAHAEDVAARVLRAAARVEQAAITVARW